MKRQVWEALASSLEAEELVAVVTVVAGPGRGRQLLLRPGGADAGGKGPGDKDPGGKGPGGLGSDELDDAAVRLAAEAFAAFASRRVTVPLDGDEVELFVDVHPPPPKLVIVGAVHVAIPLITFARRLGFRTVVIDPRSAFATAERFAEADDLICEWPGQAMAATGLNEATYVAVLSHDLKIDLPALEAALGSPARYIGALGSRKTHAKRVAALEAGGFTADEIGRIRSPIGLDIGGGRRAEEIALSVIAEVVRASHGG